MSKYHFAYYKKEDIILAEEKSRGIIGHDNILQLLEQMDLLKMNEIDWFKLSESDRDIINAYCGIPVRWRQEIKIRMLKDYNPSMEGWPFPTARDLKLESGMVYFAKSGSHGAISALCNNGEFIGVKPGEFQFLSAPDWVLQKHGICPICFKRQKDIGKIPVYKITNPINGKIYFDKPSLITTDKNTNGLSQLCIDAGLSRELTYCDIEGLLTDGKRWYLLDECGNWAYLPSDYKVEEVERR